MPTLEFDGYVSGEATLARGTLSELRNTVFGGAVPGTRCLLDVPLVRKVALSIGHELVRAGRLEESAVAVQAIAFDKTPSTNWKVTWHQDVIFPFSRRPEAFGYCLPSIKDGLHYCRPPAEVLSELLAVRLHLDRCDSDNGPLRVSPGTHGFGILMSSKIPAMLANHGEVATYFEEGGTLLMRPLLLHASSKALSASHRRVLHFVFHSGRPIEEAWYRSIEMPNQHVPDPTLASGTPPAGQEQRHRSADH
jgi:ectoine hydroxylase-related dioxygenase (phytanoyl-CoA dioxygenase family)